MIHACMSQVVVKDTVRKLVIKDTLLADAGEITAKTNVDRYISRVHLRI